MKTKTPKKLVSMIIIILILAGFTGLIIKIYSQSNINEVRNADAIVVMGASQWSGRPSPVLEARLNHALSLYNQNLAPKIILTGGVGEGQKLSESQVGKNYLINKDINNQNIFTEETGRTSWQSLNEVKKILNEQDLDSVILVSNGFHMMRLKKMSKDLRIKAFTSPVKESPIKKGSIEEFKYITRETLVYILYLLFKI
ncbi:YdcF family protein [Patescibacteria group bacterium AH-259-L05]|nr:YdcF family protein [Patescibacteria group bacterium AH-259-L05]